MTIEHKSVTTEIKSMSDGSFEGYAAYFGNSDSCGDIITPGAFTKTIAERMSKVRALWNHDSNTPPIGKVTGLAEDSSGLQFKATFSQTQLAQDIRTLVAEQALDSMSIGYSTIKADYAESEGEFFRYLKEIKLYEVSVTPFPANESAIITGSKSLSQIERLIAQLDDAIDVGIKSGRPLSAENLKRVRGTYVTLGGLLGEKKAEVVTEPKGADTEPAPLLLALKSFRLDAPQQTEAQRISAEIKQALSFLN